MAYKLIITNHADKLLNNIIHHLLYQLKNEQAAKHLLDGIENVYSRLEVNPQQFPYSRDLYLESKKYREAIVPQMDYVVVFRIDDDCVNVVGIFHQLENYQKKL